MPVSQIDADNLQISAAQWILPINRPPIERGFVAARDGKIVAVGALADLPANWSAPEPLPGSLITPGLVNAHVHLEQSFPQVIAKGPNEPFVAWLLRVVERQKAESNPHAKRERCRLGALEVLTTGTTCVNDIASDEESFKALDVLGLRGVVSLEVFHPGLAPVSITHWVERYQALQSLYAGHPRLRVGLSPHSPYNVSPAAWQAFLDVCKPPLVHTHVAEFEDELRYVQGKPSCIPGLHQAILGRSFESQALADSPVAYLADFGLLNSQTVVAHGIHTTAADRARVAQAGVGLAHCPRSNMALHGQTLRAADWQGVNVPIALGTDGRLSTENLDLRAEARYAMQLHGWNAQTALEAMTVQGAAVLGLSDTIGALSPGYAADWVLWQVPEAVMNSENQPEALVLHPDARVQRVVIDGRTCWPEGGL